MSPTVGGEADARTSSGRFNAVVTGNGLESAVSGQKPRLMEGRSAHLPAILALAFLFNAGFQVMSRFSSGPQAGCARSLSGS
jgi:hypothetical protein